MPDDHRDPIDARWSEALAPLRSGPLASATLEARVRASLAAPVPSRPGRPRWPWLAIAAVVILSGIGVLARWQPWRPDAAPAGARYLLLLYESPRYDPGGTTHEQLVAEYSAWAGNLAHRGQLVDAAELGPEEELVGAAAESTRPTAGVITGFFLVRAADPEAAAAIAATCPHLKYGGTVAVRPLREG